MVRQKKVGLRKKERNSVKIFDSSVLSFVKRVKLNLGMGSATSCSERQTGPTGCNINCTCDCFELKHEEIWSFRMCTNNLFCTGCFFFLIVGHKADDVFAAH